MRKSPDSAEADSGLLVRVAKLVCIADTRKQKYLTESTGTLLLSRKGTCHNTENPGRPILKIDSVPADKKATFSTEEIRLMRITINRLRNERLGKGQYTDAADDMLLKLF